MATKPRSLEDLTPAPYNPRTITPEALEGLSNSVQTFGDLSGIVFNQRTGHLVAGHQRVKALKAKGAQFQTDPPALTLDGETFPVRLVDWDEATERAANLTANNPWIAGDFTDAVVDIVDDLRDEFDAFDDVHLGDLIEDPQDRPEDEEVEGEVRFSETLDEENNYVVLFFETKTDWIAAQTHFGLDTVADTDSRPGYKRQGTGRVIDGAEYLARINAELEAKTSDP